MLFNRNGHNRANMIVIHVYTYNINYLYLLYIIIDRCYHNTNALLYNISDTRRFSAVLCCDFIMIKYQPVREYIYIYIQVPRYRLPLDHIYLSLLAYSDYYYVHIGFFFFCSVSLYTDCLVEKFRGDTIPTSMPIIYMSSIVPIVFVHVGIYPKSFEQIA